VFSRMPAKQQDPEHLIMMVCLFPLATRPMDWQRVNDTMFAVVCTQGFTRRAMWGLTTLSQLAFGEIAERQAVHGVSEWNDRPSAKDAAEWRAVSCCRS